MVKILIIDDDVDLLRGLQYLLKTKGFQVETMTRGDNVFNKVQLMQPHLIVMDVFLSGKDGRLICKNLKLNPSFNQIPVILFSADPYVETGISNYGANAFVQKPFEVDNLLSKINALI